MLSDRRQTITEPLLAVCLLYSWVNVSETVINYSLSLFIQAQVQLSQTNFAVWVSMSNHTPYMLPLGSFPVRDVSNATIHNMIINKKHQKSSHFQESYCWISISASRLCWIMLRCSSNRWNSKFLIYQIYKCWLFHFEFSNFESCDLAFFKALK